ncbi:hypothetical protein CsSME_00012752 [Camellia sinensis var. sinensis]
MAIILCCRYLESLMWRKKRFLYGSTHVLQQPFSDEPVNWPSLSVTLVETITFPSKKYLGDSIKPAIPNMDEFEHFSLPS